MTKEIFLLKSCLFCGPLQANVCLPQTESVQETNEDGLIGYSVKLHILDEIIAPSEWFENDGDAMVSVANEALDIVKAWHEAQQEVEAEEEEEEGNPTDNGGSSAHVWRPGQ